VTVPRRILRPAPPHGIGSFCGDVGFGKTEVAFASGGRPFVLSGKQVGHPRCRPTTILADQHGRDLPQAFPIRFRFIEEWEACRAASFALGDKGRRRKG